MDIATTAKIHDSVTFGPNCERVQIGHGVRINRDVYIDVKDLTIGDYVTIHHGTVLHGDTVTIGHNCWIGHYCILDGHGGMLSMGNNVGVGAQSQLWSHMKFGDTMAGCRWHSMDNLVIDDDVWMVGHCIVTPIHAKRGSMLMVGSLATKDMEANHVYAGSPAKDMTDKFGQQFAPTTPEQRVSGFDKLVAEYADQGNDVSWVSVVDGLWPQPVSNEVTYFNPTRMEYMPRYTSNETALMQFLLYDRAKFLPVQ